MWKHINEKLKMNNKLKSIKLNDVNLKEKVLRMVRK